MALKVKTENKEASGQSLVTPGKRLFLTQERDRLVSPDDPKARFLYCTEHSRVSRAEFERLSGKKKAASKKKASKKQTKSADEDAAEGGNG